MIDVDGSSLYIGKAKNLKARLSSYFTGKQSIKTQNVLNKLADIKVIVTHSEKEALILEQNLIKKKKPTYNILLRDDKSYPFILVSNDKFPRIDSYRGSRKKITGKLFGPYPSHHAVTKNLQLLQKLFKIRQCSNVFFRNRSRPCLQYQIKKCKAPCVNLVTETEYQIDVANTIAFLSGKENQLMYQIAKKIKQVAANLDFEQAAELRDLLGNIRKLQEQQSVDKSTGNIDAIGYYQSENLICFNVLYVRNGQVIDHTSYSPKFTFDETKEEQLEAFLAQFYIALAHSRNFPDEILLPYPIKPESIQLIIDATKKFIEKKILIKFNVKATRAQWLKLATHNAAVNIKSYTSKEKYQKIRWQQLEKLLDTTKISRIECFDVSHSKGEATVASCVVFNNSGAVKTDYRKYNITTAKAGDDYQALAEAISRRYKDCDNNSLIPDILLIDGGKGQLAVANKIITDFKLNFTVVAIAKGESRKSGLETILHNNKPLDTSKHMQAFLLLQQIRDEAHRFAITGHRNQRLKAKKTSFLESIPGVGSKRRRELLHFFAGSHGVLNATVDEIAQVKNISLTLAKTIYSHLHDDC